MLERGSIVIWNFHFILFVAIKLRCWHRARCGSFAHSLNVHSLNMISQMLSQQIYIWKDRTACFTGMGCSLKFNPRTIFRVGAISVIAFMLFCLIPLDKVANGDRTATLKACSGLLSPIFYRLATLDLA